MKNAIQSERGSMRSPRGLCEIGPARKRKHRALLVFREVAPGKNVAIVPDYEADVRKSIKLMRQAAKRAINAIGAKPSEVEQLISNAENAGRCDRAYFAASLCEQLAETETSLDALLNSSAEAAVWCGLKFGKDMGYSRFLWQRLKLVEIENLIKNGEAMSTGRKAGNEQKKRAAEVRAARVRAFVETEKASSPFEKLESIVIAATAKFNISRSTVFEILSDKKQSGTV
jgi:hypothetical protein